MPAYFQPARGGTRGGPGFPDLYGPQCLPAAAEGALEGARLQRPRGTGALQHAPRGKREVSLIDPNGQIVDARTVTTGSFGSAAGEFTIPAGRLLGNWRLRSSLAGQAAIKVEEYKRPTFEVTIKDPEKRCG